MNEQEHAAIGVILGRSGSKGLPGKNARLVAGRPMIVHSIEHARSSRHIDRVIVTTDGEEIARAARSAGRRCGCGAAPAAPGVEGQTWPPKS